MLYGCGAVYKPIDTGPFSDFIWWFIVPEFGKGICMETLLWQQDIVT
jgi:hypothetical protein